MNYSFHLWLLDRSNYLFHIVIIFMFKMHTTTHPPGLLQALRSCLKAGKEETRRWTATACSLLSPSTGAGDVVALFSPPRINTCQNCFEMSIFILNIWIYVLHIYLSESVSSEIYLSIHVDLSIHPSFDLYNYLTTYPYIYLHVSIYL